MDELRRHLINELMKDSSRARKVISDIVGKSESYISKIIKELEKDIISRHTIHVNYKNAGYRNHAFSLIKLTDIDSENVHRVSEQIATLNEAVEVFTAFGEYHLFVRWLCKDPESIMTNISKVLHAKDIAEIETTTLGKCYKRTFGPYLQERKRESDF